MFNDDGVLRGLRLRRRPLLAQVRRGAAQLDDDGGGVEGGGAALDDRVPGGVRGLAAGQLDEHDEGGVEGVPGDGVRPRGAGVSSAVLRGLSHALWYTEYSEDLIGSTFFYSRAH